MNSCLNKNCLDRNGFNRLPSWQDAVLRYNEELQKENSKIKLLKK